MASLLNYPLVVFAISVVVLSASVRTGARFGDRAEAVRDDLGVVLAATLTLLGLIVGFTFSMAVSRYDQRKLYEEEEANAIGTEYVRADLVPASDGETIRKLLRDYLDQRILFYQTRDQDALRRSGVSTAQLQTDLWAAVTRATASAQTPVTALAVSGMNDVLNSQGYSQAAWLNRIPVAAWGLLGVIAVCANVMLGLSWHRGRAMSLLIGILPAMVSTAVLLIADIDAPRGGLIHVRPVNLISLAASLRP
jgi:hypothetical protein